MKLSNPEKLIIAMLADLHEKAGLDDYNPQLLKAAIHSDNTWAIGSALPGVFGDGVDSLPEDVSEVAKFLDMWGFIERSIEALSAGEREEVKEVAKGYMRFPGFDGNNESHQMSIARTYIKDLGLFQEFAKHNLNSHHPTLTQYQQMYEVFEPMLHQGVHSGLLSAQQLKKILSA